MKKLVISVAALVLTVAPAMPAQAVVATAVPGSYVAGWATPVIVTPRGGPVTVSNADIVAHQLVATGSFLPRKKAKKAPWCKSYGSKSCPRFWSESVATGQTTQVQGLQYIKSGQQYAFICAIHPSMTGVLVGI